MEAVTWSRSRSVAKSVRSSVRSALGALKEMRRTIGTDESSGEEDCGRMIRKPTRWRTWRRSEDARRQKREVTPAVLGDGGGLPPPKREEQADEPPRPEGLKRRTALAGVREVVGCPRGRSC